MAAPAPPAAPPTLLRLARVPLLTALAALVLAGALGWLGSWRKDAALADAQAAAGQLQKARTDLAEAEDARRRLEANLRQFDALRQSGFVGVADRVGLLEGVELAARALPGAPLRWELESARSIQTVNDPTSGSAIADVNVIPMRLQSEQLHEEDWLALMAQLRQSAQGQVRVQGCDWQRGALSASQGTVPSLRAQCEFLWTHLIPQETPR